MFSCLTFGASASRSSSVFGSLGIYQAVQVNDSLYELHRPLSIPHVQIVLFHGLQKDGYSEAHLSTWLSQDGSCIWPKQWLAEEISGVHVFSVRYIGDIYIIGENLLSDLLHGEIGQKRHCPVILVGHSIGGLVIKQLCQQAHYRLHISAGSEKAKYEAFLSNLKGIFWYSTPHHGSQIADKLAQLIPRPLFSYFEALSKDTARLNHEFEGLCKLRDSWLIAGLSEGLATNLGPFKYFFKDFVVREASARIGDFNVVNDADHFSICRPRDKTSRSFYKLKEFVHRIANDAQEESIRLQEEARKQEEIQDAKNREDVRLQEEARALENLRPENFQYVPKSVVGLDIQVQAIKSKLDNVRTLGLVGMGGLGKTTLANEVFNRLAPSFDYTCYIPRVKLIDGDEMKIKGEIEQNMHFRGKKVAKGSQQGWITKPLLLVLDDMSEESDGKILSEMENTIASESRIIFTTRNQSPVEYSDQVYKVETLNEILAEQLFLSYAFKPRPSSPDHRTPPIEFEALTHAIVKMCERLPLALEVVGKYLGTTKNKTVWEQTLEAMGRAKDHPDINKRLWEVLRVSYDGLGEKPQQMFLDAVIVFKGPQWTLREAKAAWRIVYDALESVLWKKLVDMSLVYDVEEDDTIRVHEQLESLGRAIALEPSNNGRRRVWDGHEGLKLLQNVEESHGQGIFALRVGEDVIYDGSEDRKLHIPKNAVDSLVQLRYLELNVPVVIDGAQDGLPIQAKLVLLDCKWPDSAEALLPALRDNIALLKLRWEKSCLPTCVGSFSKLRVLRFYRAQHLESLPDEIGNLSQLQQLVLEDSHRLQTLPETFGNLSALNHLVFNSCVQLQALPESFGNLSALNHLVLNSCVQLQALPESFGNLSALNHLVFESCNQLRALPESFGNLCALSHLVFESCVQLQALQESFGNLSILNHLEFRLCPKLQALPESFGNLSALNHLVFESCNQLRALPESFGNLCALSHLVFESCVQLQALPETFGNLSVLKYLEFRWCHELQALPESFGNLSALNYLNFVQCDQLQALPESFGNLSALNHLEFKFCDLLQALPESFGNLSFLIHLQFFRCYNLLTLPESFRNLCALEYLEFGYCDHLKALPEFLRGALPIDPSNIIFSSSKKEDDIEDDIEWLW